MYRTNDPRFRRRLHDISATLESANESAQSSLYIFGQRYVRPCLESVGSCLTSCVDASCPSLNISQNQRERDRRRRQRGRGRAELSFDFYDDWDDELEGEGWGWGNDEFDRLVGAGGSGGYGTVNSTTQQPGRQRGMSYPKGRRKSAVLPIEGAPPGAVIPGSGSFWSRLFGGKPARYKPSAADLQEHPGAKRHRRDRTEGEALLDDIDEDTGHRTHRRNRSGTQGTTASESSLSSRGDLFPSDEEDDAIPLDDEFAMVLERRTTQSGNMSGGASAQETESASSGKTRDKRGKRPSAGSRTSTRRTASSRSLKSAGMRKDSTRSRAESTTLPIDESPGQEDVEPILSLAELKSEERQVEQEEELQIKRKRSEAKKLAEERGLAEDLSSKEATPLQGTSPRSTPASRNDEPSQLPTPLATDDEDGEAEQQPISPDKDTQL
ncbi:hypothetical protein PRZ48_008664 [Zasmidium cellare]|uniref:Uncharacterized protein n=1 Tax=Zasmidium cellare TaxID=395010 RepID=A0ABR0EH62_ZASCE|nr:hypothetical protein PRZ48_008664 [Zasmidium cellare]